MEQSGIHRLVVPVPFPVDPLNIYLVTEPVPTLIDTPPRGQSFLTLLDQRLNSLGYSIADVERIILTHPHFDHYGSVADIVKKSGAQVYAAAGTQFCFQAEAIEQDKRFQHDLMEKTGAPLPWIEHATKTIGGWAKQYGCDFTPSEYLQDGCPVRLADRDTTVVSVPGHTPWCILIYDQVTGTAFTGDFLLDHISSNPIIQRPSIVPKGYGSLKALISSLRKVRLMELRLALPGHGRLIEDPNARIEELLTLIHDRKSLVYDILAAGRQTLFQMVTRLFPNLRKEELFLAISEFVGHLEVLEEEGSVVRKEGEALGFYVC